MFVHNRETVEGAIRHTRVDGGSGELAAAEELAPEDVIHARSVMLSSDRVGLIAKMDLIEVADGIVTPVDYKRGKPFVKADGTLDVWDADRVQMTAQAIVLRDNGYSCSEAVLYYSATKQRVRIEIDDAAVEWAIEKLRAAREIAAAGVIPPPLVDSPKCPKCSLVGICLPDETRAMWAAGHESKQAQRTMFGELNIIEAPLADELQEREVRQLLPARDDLRPLGGQVVLLGHISGQIIEHHIRVRSHLLWVPGSFNSLQ